MGRETSRSSTVTCGSALTVSSQGGTPRAKVSQTVSSIVSPEPTRRFQAATVETR